VAGLELRFAGVQPEDLDAEFVVVALDPLPDVRACLGVGGVVEGDLGGAGAEALVRPVGVGDRTVLGADEQALIQHRMESINDGSAG